jgi:hypothetical protein
LQAAGVGDAFSKHDARVDDLVVQRLVLVIPQWPEVVEDRRYEAEHCGDGVEQESDDEHLADERELRVNR